MLVPTDSPLRRLPGALMPHQRVLLDALRYGFEMLDAAYIHLLDAAAAISMATRKGETLPQRSVAEVLFAAWAVVDVGHRLGAYARRLPNAKKSAKTIKFIETMKLAGDVRDTGQHLDDGGRFKHSADTGAPIWGQIEWLVPESPQEFRLHVLVSGTIVSSQIPISTKLTEEKQIRSPVDHFRLLAHGDTVSLTDMWDSVNEFARGLETDLETQLGHLPASGADTVLTLLVGSAEPTA